MSLRSIAKLTWHWVVCRPAFTWRFAETMPFAQLVTGAPVCHCGKLCRRG